MIVRCLPPDRRDLADGVRATLDGDLAQLASPRPQIYWLDLMTSALLGWSAFLLAVRVGPWTVPGIALTALATLAHLRALVFLHEIAHHRGSPRFELFWNLLVGIPMCVPSSMYVGSHLEHHATHRFATRTDPEYAPIASWGFTRRLGFVVTGALVPVLLVLRWGLLAPLSLGPLRRLRPVVVERCSTLAINPGYVRDREAYERCRRFRVLEWACAAFVWTAAAATLAGALPAAVAAEWLAVVGGVFAVNQLRTLAAHGYARFGSRLDREGQFLDSINLAASPLTRLVAPLGLRHHALHHLLPELPYHGLARAHRLLVTRLAADSLYRRSRELGLARAIRSVSRAA